MNVSKPTAFCLFFQIYHKYPLIVNFNFLCSVIFNQRTNSDLYNEQLNYDRVSLSQAGSKNDGSV